VEEKLQIQMEMEDLKDLKALEEPQLRIPDSKSLPRQQPGTKKDDTCWS
jgi:hypothetical protein